MKPILASILLTILIFNFLATIFIPMAMLLSPRKSAVQAAVVVYVLLGGKDVQQSSYFTDLDGCTDIEKLFIEQARAIGITVGTGGTNFSPNQRTQLYMWLLFLGRAIQYAQHGG
jgi:hypothetical protein